LLLQLWCSNEKLLVGGGEQRGAKIQKFYLIKGEKIVFERDDGKESHSAYNLNSMTYRQNTETE